MSRFETDCYEVRALARALVGQSKEAYEKMRKVLIEQEGYDTFRDLQCRAFEVALYGREVSRPPCTCHPARSFHTPGCPEYRR